MRIRKETVDKIWSLMRHLQLVNTSSIQKYRTDEEYRKHILIGKDLKDDHSAIEVYCNPFLRKKGKVYFNLIKWLPNRDARFKTPLIDNKDCYYVIFDGKTALCGIEQAYNQGIVD